MRRRRPSSEERRRNSAKTREPHGTVTSRNEDNNIAALAHFSYDNTIKKNKTDYTLLLSVKTDFYSDNIADIGIDIKTWITDNVNFFISSKNIYYSNTDDFQFKVGLGFKL